LNYFSYLDNFNLTLNDLVNLSHSKLTEIIEDLNIDPKEKFPQILEDLTNDKIRQHHYTIEEHVWLKNILLNNLDNIKQHDIHLNSNSITNNEDFKQFLAPYLYPKVSSLINHFLDKEAYITLFKILEVQDLLSNKLKKSVITTLKAKLNYASNYIEDGLLTKNLSNINYVKSFHVFNSLNLFDDAFNKDLSKLYYTLLNIHDQFEIDSTSKIFKFTSQALVAFGNSELDDIGTKLLIDDNANNAKKYAYKNYNATVKGSNNNVLKTFGILTFILALAITFQFFKLIRSQNPIKKYEESSTQITSNTFKKKRLNYDSRIRFYYTLKRKIIKGKPSPITSNKLLIEFSNPYHKTFSIIPNNMYLLKDINTFIDNNTNKDVIVFRMIKGSDQSIYIPKKTSRYIRLEQNDSLLFYYGNQFIPTKLSYFNKNAAISEVYKIIDKPEQSNYSITINENTADSKPKIIEDKAIITKGLKLKKMKLNNLYTKYYNTYSN